MKTNATRVAFERVFGDPNTNIHGISVPSLVSDMPLDDETYVGAKNRAQALLEVNRQQQLNADYAVAIEGGMFHNKVMQKWMLQGAVVVINIAESRTSLGITTAFELPDHISKAVIESNKEIGTVIDEITGEQNVKQKGGAISYLTNGLVVRQDLYEQGLQMALVPFMQSHLYVTGKKQ